jgi:hypothetical protein
MDYDTRIGYNWVAKRIITNGKDDTCSDGGEVSEDEKPGAEVVGSRTGDWEKRRKRGSIDNHNNWKIKCKRSGHCHWANFDRARKSQRCPIVIYLRLHESCGKVTKVTF